MTTPGEIEQSQSTPNPRPVGGNTPSIEPPEGCHWTGPWRQLDDPIWKWTRYYESEKGVIGCVERRATEDGR